MELKIENEAIVYLQAHCLVIQGGTLEEFYCGKKLKHIYYRLDFEPNVMGLLFKEPLPHLHVLPKGEPRLVFNKNSPTLITDFLEFIYINHAYDKWLKWVKEIWDKKGKGPFIAKKEEDQLNAIIKSFNASKILLEELMPQFNELRKLLKQEKQNRWKMSLDSRYLQFNYP